MSGGLVSGYALTVKSDETIDLGDWSDMGDGVTGLTEFDGGVA